MKKYLFPALALGLVMTSCQSDEPFAPTEGGEKQVTFTLNVPGELGTRADFGENKSDKGGLSNNAGELSYTLVLDANGDQRTFTQKGAGSVVFNPTVVLGRNYTVTAYAHFGEAWDGAKAIDITKHFNDETKDAYFKQENIKFELNETSKQITLKRPFGKLRLLATDYKVDNTNELNTAVEKVTITYNDAKAAKFNAFNSEFVFDGDYVNTGAKDFGYYAAESDAMPIFADYIPANSDDNMVDFTVTVKYAGSNETYSRTFNDIPVRRNALTTLKGNFFTAGAEITVEVDDDFEGGQIPGERNEKEQLIIAAAMGGKVTLTEDVVLDAPLKVQANMVLNLNGQTITTTEKETGRHHYAIDNYATLVIEGEGAIEARGIQNFGEMTVNGNVTVKNLDSNGGAAIWNEGKVTINNGTFISSEKAGANSDGAALNIRENASATVNGGVFRSEATHCYAIICGGNLTINNADVKGKHGAVGAFGKANIEIKDGKFEQIDNPNTSDHCILGKGVAPDVNNQNVTLEIKGGQYKIEDCAEKNGGQVFWGECLADGYKVVENGGWRYVVPAEAVVVTTAKELTNALANGGNVVLTNDIDFGSTQLAITGENQVVDLGGHTLTTANIYGGISLKNGACIKNGTITHTGNTAAIKAFNGTSVENVTINATCKTADKTVTGIAVQQRANVESIKNVTINGVSQGIEVCYQATVGLIENAVVNESNNGTANGIGLVINGGKVGKAKDCTFKGETYGITMHLKGVFAAGLELENCTVEGTTASIYAWDEKGISNTSGSLILTYDAATTLTGPFVWDFEDECKGVVTLNQPQ